MPYVIIVTRQEGRKPVAFGPYHRQNRADERATALNDHFEEHMPGCAASVVWLELPTQPLEDMIEESLYPCSQPKRSGSHRWAS